MINPNKLQIPSWLAELDATTPRSWGLESKIQINFNLFDDRFIPGLLKSSSRRKELPKQKLILSIQHHDPFILHRLIPEGLVSPTSLVDPRSGTST